MPEQKSDKNKESSLEVFVIGILFALILVIGTPVFGGPFGTLEKGSVITAVPVAVEHIAGEPMRVAGR